MNKSVIVVLVLLLLFSGCTTYHAKIGNAEIKMTYFLQDKTFKSFTYDPNTNTVTIQNFGSETSQVIGAAISAALGGVK